MSKDGTPDFEPSDPVTPGASWPSWFLEPEHPFERDVLLDALRSNQQLWDVHFAVGIMQINYLVFRRNYEELDRIYETFNQPANFRELALQTDQAQRIVQETILEFTRALHNYLASAKMLVDVTRRWVRQRFEASEFLEQYQTEVRDRFASNVQAQFLEDLRNFTLHRSLPLSIPELRMQQVSDKRLRSSLGIVLLKDYLLEWDEWSELGAMQIQMAFEGEIDIVTVCNQYYENVTQFNQWLFWNVRRLYEAEIAQINSVIEHLRAQSQ